MLVQDLKSRLSNGGLEFNLSNKGKAKSQSVSLKGRQPRSFLVFLKRTLLMQDLSYRQVQIHSFVDSRYPEFEFE